MDTRSKMSSRERMLAALSREAHDHVPFSPYISQGPVWKAPLFWRDQTERAECLLELGLDPTMDIWFPDPQPHRDVKIKTWRERNENGKLIITKEYHTPAGILRQSVKETDDWCNQRHGPWIPSTWGIEKRDHFGIDLFDDYNVSRRTTPWVKGPEDLDKLRYIIRLPEGHILDEWYMDAERAKEFARKHDILLTARRTIVGDAFQWFCDINEFMCWMIDAPDFVEEFLGIFNDWALGMAKMALEADVDIVIRRGWYESPVFCGKKYWSKYIAPTIGNETGLVHEAGKLHSYLLPEGQGAYASILDEMEFDILQGIDPRMLHGGNLETLYEQTGEKKSFWGGVNAEVTLETQDEELIDAAVKEAIEALDANNGLVLSAFLFPEVPQNSIMHMINSWKKYR